MTKTPYDSSYWVVPGKLLAGNFPASTDEIVRRIKLNGLVNSGIKAVVNLMEEDEKNYSGQSFFDYAPILNRHDIETKRFPIKTCIYHL